MASEMKKLPQLWWCFLPVWLWLPAFLGIITLVVRVNLWTGFFAACVYMLLSLLAYAPMRRNQLSVPQTLFWVGLGTAVLGIPGVVLIYVLFGKT
ncbi:MAG: hypothetical protein N3J91_03005 [Verrucomicrobiae bacterium]|nr:hypothetical protein [Verrucomicrobiae bacterium]